MNTATLAQALQEVGCTKVLCAWHVTHRALTVKAEWKPKPHQRTIIVGIITQHLLGAGARTGTGLGNWSPGRVEAVFTQKGV